MNRHASNPLARNGNVRPWRSLGALLAPLCAAVLAAPVPAAAVQGGGPLSGREAMWPAPTAEQWQRPCLIRWQRTWEDAVEVSRRTRRPILVCINMDGEIASEHYAGVRYRQPEIAALYEPYVCVIASVYRHSPRDYDGEGRRIPCPRFGTVTCGEHIAIEPLLFERFMDGRRIAPRHIMVELDGAETYDVYYAFDTASVFDTIRSGVAGRDFPPQSDLGERDLVERLTSPDSADRERVEAEYQAADAQERRRILRAAVDAGGDTPVDLLRLAVFGLDAELNRLALLALAKAEDESAVGLIAEALRVPMSAADRESLIAALERLGTRFPKAATIAAVHRGLDARSDAIDVEGWSVALSDAREPAEPLARTALEYQMESVSTALRTRREDPQALLEAAEAALALAVDPETVSSLRTSTGSGARFEGLLFEDALRAARRAEAAGADGWRLDAVLALASFYAGDREEAARRAEAAVAAIPSGETSWNAMAVMALFAQARQRAVYQAVRRGEEWPSQWLTDVNATYEILARHPLGTDQQVVSHYDFLKYLGGTARAAGVLDAGLERFPESWLLHDRLRARILEEHGVEGLEESYARMLEREDADPTLEWFAGYAALVAAEFHRRTGDVTAAEAAYGRAIDHYERTIERDPAARDSSDHYIAVALAGRARLALERTDLQAAVELLSASLRRKPEAAAALDGLGLSAVATARTLKARLEEAGDQASAARVQAALDELDPVLLDPPAFERQGQDPGSAGGGRGRSRQR